MKAMNHNCIRAAVAVMAAGLAGYATAQSNVIVYGNLDLGLVKETGSKARIDRGNNNWLGFKGTEDLGNGLSALFNIQMRFNPDTGEQEKPTAFQGETTVGLASKALGKLRIGRALTPFWATKWAYDPWWDTQFNGSVGAYQNGSYSSDPTNALGFANFARIPNGVFYDSAEFGGFQIRAAAEVEKAVGATDRTQSLATNYTNGPFAATVAYEKNKLKDDIIFLGGSYSFGAFTLMGTYGKVELRGAPHAEHNYSVAGMYTVGVHTLRFGYGRTNDIGGADDSESQHKTAIGYVHALSKRTNLYADLYRENAATIKNGVALGINHTF